MMGIPAKAPQAVRDYWNSIPQDNVGDFYACVRPPFLPFGLWFKVPVWGQVCDGQPHRDAVGCMLHNKFPFKGRGWTYIAWRAEPYNHERCKYPRKGIVENPKPFDPAKPYNA
jgi:hypothetical protein